MDPNVVARSYLYPFLKLAGSNLETHAPKSPDRTSIDQTATAPPTEKTGRRGNKTARLRNRAA